MVILNNYFIAEWVTCLNYADIVENQLQSLCGPCQLVVHPMLISLHVATVKVHYAMNFRLVNILWTKLHFWCNSDSQCFISTNNKLKNPSFAVVTSHHNSYSQYATHGHTNNELKNLTVSCQKTSHVSLVSVLFFFFWGNVSLLCKMSIGQILCIWAITTIKLKYRIQKLMVLALLAV
jgi:hypothetical protein